MVVHLLVTNKSSKFSYISNFLFSILSVVTLPELRQALGFSLLCSQRWKLLHCDSQAGTTGPSWKLITLPKRKLWSENLSSWIIKVQSASPGGALTLRKINRWKKQICGNRLVALWLFSKLLIPFFFFFLIWGNCNFYYFWKSLVWHWRAFRKLYLKSEKWVWFGFFFFIAMKLLVNVHTFHMINYSWGL